MLIIEDYRENEMFYHRLAPIDHPPASDHQFDEASNEPDLNIKSQALIANAKVS